MQSHLEARLWNSVFIDAQVRAWAHPDVLSQHVNIFPILASHQTACALGKKKPCTAADDCTALPGCSEIAPSYFGLLTALSRCVFNSCLQEALGIPQGTIKATVLIETLPAAFEMDEILYELRQVGFAGFKAEFWAFFLRIKCLHAACCPAVPSTFGDPVLGDSVDCWEHAAPLLQWVRWGLTAGCVFWGCSTAAG